MQLIDRNDGNLLQISQLVYPFQKNRTKFQKNATKYPIHIIEPIFLKP